MPLLTIKLLLLLSTASSLISIKDKRFLFVLLLSSILLFIVSYTFLDNSFADDRAQYYYWFQNNDWFLQTHHDQAFSYFFSFLSLFTKSSYGLYLSLSLVFLILSFLSVLNLSDWKKISIFMSLLLINRLYLDYDMNAIRSTLASLLLFFIYTQAIISKKHSYLFLLPIAFFLHGSIFVVITFLYFCSKFLSTRWAFYLFCLSVIVFLLDIHITNNLISQPVLVNFFQSINNNIHEMIRNTEAVSSILKLQFCIYIILPALLMYRYRTSILLDEHLRFALVAIALVLFVYDSFPILSRSFAFIMPLLYYLLVHLFKTNSKILYFYTAAIVTLNSLIFYKNINLLAI